ncbi:sulfotransferase family 2 domain-containing protein [Alteromonas sp. H39]|uniref:sulfotransferase family 2 domain-containing protein n=1 Tax=Alteromonas sp. H39 TaxID=3389876 RepID=UPI0039DFFDBE
MKEPIFIHIPKTGGTSINCVIKGTSWQTPINYHYRHLVFETKKSSCGDIFQRDNLDRYRDEFIFMMLRDPLDRLISEYYYIRNNQDFMQYLTSQPRSFEEYIDNPQTSNYMLKFLDGRRIYDDDTDMSEQRTNEIIGIIDELNIHTGIFEQYALSLSYLSSVGDFQWPDTIDVKRATLNRPQVRQISTALRERILANNAMDMKLYNHCLARLAEHTKALAVQKIKFKGGRLDFVIPYTMYNCILDVELQNKTFIETNKTFLVTLNHYLHKTVSTGKDYTKNWLSLFRDAVSFYYPNTRFAKQVKSIKRNHPLDEVVAIARLIDSAPQHPELGLDITQPKLQLRLTRDMAKVMRRDDVVAKGTHRW